MTSKIIPALLLLLSVPGLCLAAADEASGQKNKMNNYRQQWQDYQNQYQLESSGYRKLPRKPTEKKASGFYATGRSIKEEKQRQQYEPPNKDMPKSQRDYLEGEKQEMFDGLGYELKQTWQKGLSKQNLKRDAFKGKMPVKK